VQVTQQLQMQKPELYAERQVVLLDWST